MRKDENGRSREADYTSFKIKQGRTNFISSLRIKIPYYTVKCSSVMQGACS